MIVNSLVLTAHRIHRDAWILWRIPGRFMADQRYMRSKLFSRAWISMGLQVLSHILLGSDTEVSFPTSAM